MVSLCISGCGSNQETTETTDSEQPLIPLPTAGSSDTEEEAEEGESSWSGFWKLVITEETTDFNTILLEIRPYQGQYAIRKISSSPMKVFQEWGVGQASFNEDDVVLLVGSEQMVFQFIGRRYDDVVLGSIMRQEEKQPSMARLIKTTENEFASEQTPSRTKGVDQFQAALQSDDPISALQKFVEDSPKSPLTSGAYIAMLDLGMEKKLPPDEVKGFVTSAMKSLRQWGDIFLPNALLRVSSMTMLKSEYRGIAKDALDKLGTILEGEDDEFYQKQFKLQKSQLQLASESEEEQQTGETNLVELLKERPFELNGWLSLASFYEDKDRKEEALKIYSKLTALPGISRRIGTVPNADGSGEQTLMEKTQDLSGKSGEEFDDYLDEVYEKEAFYFVPESTEKTSRPENPRTPLIELFTGATCPPCVAGDLALGGVEKVYPAPEVIAIRYHQHIPGPDPLTVRAGEARFSYYSGASTPSIRINGRETGGVGGTIPLAESKYGMLMNQLKPMLSQTSPVKIDLQTTVEGKSLKLNAKVEGVAEARNSVKLRFVIVSPLVDYTAANGVRHHEMVARAMPGGNSGISVENGKAEYSETIDIAELKASIIKEVKDFEEGANYEFDEIPVDFSELRVIAFAQDDTSREVLQSTISPVLNFVLE